MADNKVTNDDGQGEFDEKIVNINNRVIIGYSGRRALFNTYLNKINILINQKNNITDNELLGILTDEISNYRYSKSLEILLGIANYNDTKSSIFNIFYTGGFEIVPRHLEIGSGAQYSMVFLNQNWNQNLNMLQVSKMGYYIIRYIETLKLDDSVGLNGKYPSIWYIPDAKLPYKVTDYKLYELKEIIEKRVNPLKESIILSDLL